MYCQRVFHLKNEGGDELEVSLKKMVHYDAKLMPERFKCSTNFQQTFSYFKYSNTVNP